MARHVSPIFVPPINFLCKTPGSTTWTPQELWSWDIQPEGNSRSALRLTKRVSVASVSLAGVVDLQRAHKLHLSHDAVVEFLHGTPSEVPDHYREADPMELSIPTARQWLIHGSADDEVPVAFSRDYVSTKQNRSLKEKEDVHLLEISNAGHFDVIDPRSAAWKQVEALVLRLSE